MTKQKINFRDTGWAILGKQSAKGIVPSWQILVKKTGTSPTDRYPEKKFWFGCSGYEHTLAIYPTYQTAYSDLQKARKEKHFVMKEVVIRKVMLEVIS
jgi:hypothetical protein